MHNTTCHGNDQAMKCIHETVDQQSFPEAFRYRESVLAMLKKKGVDLDDARKRAEAKFGKS